MIGGNGRIGPDPNPPSHFPANPSTTLYPSPHLFLKQNVAISGSALPVGISPHVAKTWQHSRKTWQLIHGKTGNGARYGFLSLKPPIDPGRT